MSADGSVTVRELVERVLGEHPFQPLCQKLLPLLPEAALLTFINGLVPAGPLAPLKTAGCGLGVAEALVLAGMTWEALEAPLLITALCRWCRVNPCQSLRVNLNHSVSI